MIEDLEEKMNKKIEQIDDAIPYPEVRKLQQQMEMLWNQKKLPKFDSAEMQVFAPSK